MCSSGFPEQRNRNRFQERFNRLLEEVENDTQFADKVGIHRNTVRQYKTGDRAPNADTLALICTACQVSADWLLGLSDVKTPDASLKAAADYTGLKEGIVKYLHEMASSSSDLHEHDILSIILSDPFWVLFQRDFMFLLVKYMQDALTDSNPYYSSEKTLAQEYRASKSIESLMGSFHLKTREFISGLPEKIRASDQVYNTLVNHLLEQAEGDRVIVLNRILGNKEEE